MAKTLKKVAMLSTHGYFDPKPKLGRTDTGGQVVYVLELAKAMSKKGIKVDIYTRWFDKRKLQVDPVPGNPDVRVIRINAGPWEFIPKESIYVVLPELAENMIDFINQHELDYDLFHGHYVDAGVVTLEVAKAFSKPAFFTAHSLGEWKRDQMGGDPDQMEKKYNFDHRIAEENRIFSNVTAQTVTSEVQLEKLNQFYKIDEEKVEIIPPGVNIHLFKMADKEELAGYDDIPENYIFCLSRIDANKGHDLLLNAFDLVNRETKGVKLVIGGGSPTPRGTEKEVFDIMHRIIREKNMESNVILQGYIPDELLIPFYQKAELFVLPSLFEPFGMTTQEAMACGKPVVASKFGGIRNVIENEVNGLLVDPTDPREFADAMIRLVKDDDYRKRIGRAGHNKIREEYSWEAISDKFIKFYDRYM